MIETAVAFISFAALVIVWAFVPSQTETPVPVVAPQKVMA